MFMALNERERQEFFTKNTGCFIPGYTGHCPTLRFQYGTSYGTKTKEILQDLRDKKVIKNVQRSPYKEIDYGKTMFSPIKREKDQTQDASFTYKNKSNRYIIGYTGFVPTLNFRYGKSYGRAADDSMDEFSEKQERYRENRNEIDRMRAQSAPKLTSLRNEDTVEYILREKEDKFRYKDREVSPDFPPIAGYTGYVPKVKGNEESLSHRYNTVVKRSLTLMKEERENRDYMKHAEEKIKSYLKDYNSYEPTLYTKKEF